MQRTIFSRHSDECEYLLPPLRGKGEAGESEALLRAAERVHREVHTGLQAEQEAQRRRGRGKFGITVT